MHDKLLIILQGYGSNDVYEIGSLDSVVTMSKVFINWPIISRQKSPIKVDKASSCSAKFSEFLKKLLHPPNNEWLLTRCFWKDFHILLMCQFSDMCL